MAWENMTDIQKVATGAELSALNEANDNNNELLLRLKESSTAIENEALKVIDAMFLAFDLKNETIEKMRSWRKTIEFESAQTTKSINALTKNLSHERLSQLREFADIIERINKINPGLLVGKLFAE